MFVKNFREPFLFEKIGLVKLFVGKNGFANLSASYIVICTTEQYRIVAYRKIVYRI